MAAWLSAGTPHGKERCACPADEGSTAAAHPARSGDTQAVLLTDLSGSSASSRQPPQLPHQGSRTRPATSSKGATENIITPPPLTSRKRAGARQTLRLSCPHPRQCSLLGDLSRPRHCDFGSVPHTRPANTAHAWGEPDRPSGCGSSLPTREGTPVRGSQPSVPDAVAGRLPSPLQRVHPALPSAQSTLLCSCYAQVAKSPNDHQGAAIRCKKCKKREFLLPSSSWGSHCYRRSGYREGPEFWVSLLIQEIFR